MDNWPVVPLRRLAIDMQPGFACQPTDEDDGLPQLRTNNVSRDGQIDLSLIKRVPAKKAQIAKYSLLPGDVLFNNTNSPALVGKTALFNEDAPYLFSNHMTRIRVDTEVLEPAYLARFLHKEWEAGAFSGLVTQWVSQAAINREQLGGVGVPMPPLSEQRRIVEILDRADHLRRLRAEANTKTNRILPALFLKMFGDPMKNPRGLLQKAIGECLHLQNGRAFHSSEWAEAGDPIIRIQNLKDNRAGFNYYRGPRLDDKFWVPRGELLFSWSGTPGTSFGAFLWDGPAGWLNQHIFRVSSDPPIDKVFLKAHLDALLPAIIGASHGGVGLRHITKEKLNRFPLLFPPDREVVLFSQQATSLEAQRSDQGEASQRIEMLWPRLMSDAFSGSLTARWRLEHVASLDQERENQGICLARRGSGGG